MSPNPIKFIGFGAIDVTKPYRFIGFGAMDVTYAVALLEVSYIIDSGPDEDLG